MADGEGRSPWQPPGPFSKRDLLETAVTRGGIYTAMLVESQHFEEVPYFGAIEHATQLEADGLFKNVTSEFRSTEPDFWTAAGAQDFKLWKATDKGHDTILGKKP